MMYPYMTLADDTEITHSPIQGDGTVKVYIETPCNRGFNHATCILPTINGRIFKDIQSLISRNGTLSFTIIRI